jgi:GT2 family glycosyltransferase
MNVRVGIVILNYRTPENASCLAVSMSRFEQIQDVVIVDNCSGDNSIDIIKKNIADTSIVFIESKENGGYARGNNIGLRYLAEECGCDICFVANPDIEISEENFNRMIEAFKNHEEYSLLTCCRKFSDGTSMRQTWNLPGYRDLLLECSALYRKIHLRIEFLPVDNDEDVKKIEVAPGAFWGIRSSAMKAVGYLDEDTFLYYEENCLGRKMKDLSLIEGIVTNARYVSFKEESSTNEIRKNGKAFRYLCDSKKVYAKKYVCRTACSYWVLEKLLNFSVYELEVWSNIRQSSWIKRLRKQVRGK